jgi:hypothetical protein
LTCREEQVRDGEIEDGSAHAPDDPELAVQPELERALKAMDVVDIKEAVRVVVKEDVFEPFGEGPLQDKPAMKDLDIGEETVGL